MSDDLTPSPEALEAAVDFLWPTYRPNVSRDQVRRGDIQCQRLALAFDRFADRGNPAFGQYLQDTEGEGA